MADNITFKVHDIAVLKKKHPCGSFDWEIMRTGTDVKIRCLGCDHTVMLPRSDFVKRIKKIKPSEE